MCSAFVRQTLNSISVKIAENRLASHSIGVGEKTYITHYRPQSLRIGTGTRTLMTDSSEFLKPNPHSTMCDCEIIRCVCEIVTHCQISHFVLVYWYRIVINCWQLEWTVDSCLRSSFKFSTTFFRFMKLKWTIHPWVKHFLQLKMFLWLINRKLSMIECYHI